MIQFLEYPAENQVLLDGNNTLIKVISTNGIGYYFIAKIYVDGVLFDTQGWSRQDEFTSNKDLIYLYHAYFKSLFSGTLINGVSEQTNLKKSVYIEVEEYDFATDTLQESITSPTFCIMYSIKPEMFDNETVLKMLNISSISRNHSKGKIIVPFYAKTNNQEITIELFDSLNSLLYTVTIPSNAVLEKRVFLFQLDLNTLTILSSCTYLSLKITIDSVVQIVTYKLINLPNYPIKEMIYQNNYGFFIPAYFDGDFEDSTGLKIDSYENKSAENVIYNIDQEGNYTINCGNLNNQECDIISEVSKSLKTYLLINNEYLSINTATKKVTNFKDRQNIYSQDLQFTFKKDAPISNIGLTIDSVITLDPAEIEITSISLETIYGIPLTTNFTISFTKNRNPSVLEYEFITNDDVHLGFNELSGTTSPQIVNSGLTNLKGMRLKYLDGVTIIYSGIYEFA